MSSTGNRKVGAFFAQRTTLVIQLGIAASILASMSHRHDVGIPTRFLV